MNSAKKLRAIGLSSLLLVILVGCGDLANLLNSNGTENNAKAPATSAIATDPVTKLPADVPADIPILDGAKGITAVRTGDGVTKGDGFYQLSFRVASGLEETATIYRNKLAEKKYDYVDEPVADSVSLTGNTPSWIFYLTIAKSTEVKGETSVTISYTK